MPDYRIVEVQSKKDLKKFVGFPDQLYRDCPQYVPALHSDQVKSLTAVSTLSYCKHRMWMVMDGKKVVGRICGMINPRYNERYGKKRARFGWFDTINDIGVARLLLGTAESWAREQGMTEIHGPLYYNTLGKQGMLVEGYENVPPFNCLYNYPYYNDLVTALGFEKECDWIQYKLRADQPVPEKMVAIADRLMERYKLVEGDIDSLKKDKALVRKFFQIYNDSFAETVYNFIPFTDEEIAEEAEQTIGLLDKRLCCFLLDGDGEIAAFGISFPSISVALQKAKGSMFPFGWVHFLKALKKFDTIDLMINGAAPKWQNTGVSSVFHNIMARQYREAGVKWAITNPQIETNSAAFVWNKYGDHELFMRRRCYLKEIK
ncbi:MAG: hypothetical protein IAB80_08775 [Bacteroidetes bacterium]|uniref:N-acetyltransferase domain-containing protein n=1 Tax=Candidatus Cryptobacteroides excrementipullorum TaxID=2840761 RepID=A0A9D9IWV0_9BACT|nr:hypothetical protein [Candidatus Cryptobacteroides excrementipullorum]